MGCRDRVRVRGDRTGRLHRHDRVDDGRFAAADVK
jgi:hypothetical protein